MSHFIQWEASPSFWNPFCPSPCDFPLLLSPPFKRTQIVFVNGNCRQKRQAKWISWRGIVLPPSPHSLCHVRLKEKEKRTIGRRFSVQNSLLERLVQFPAQRNFILHFVHEVVELLSHRFVTMIWCFRASDRIKSKGTWVIQKVSSDGLLKNKNLFPNHLYCHFMYILYATYRHSFHHCWGTCRSGEPVFVSLHRRMMPPAMQSTC
jgi:hypothetical protein